jgi:hypothetical protein
MGEKKGSAGRARLYESYPGISFTAEEKARKTLNWINFVLDLSSVINVAE